jgi:tetratricopeptide (TPR) repeat protein
MMAPRARIALWLTAALLMVAPALAQDAKNEPTFEDTLRKTMGPENCDKVDIEIYFVSKKRWPAIAAIFEELVHNPRNTALHTKLGNEFAGLTLWAGAEASYRCAILFDGNNAQAWNNLGLVLLGKRDVKGSIAALNRALVVDVNYAKAHYHLGMAYDAADRYDEALRSYERAMSLDPRLALSRFNPQVASNPHRMELFMRRLLSEQALRYNLGDPDDIDD